MTITPDQAHDLLDGATPGPWKKRHDRNGTPIAVIVSAGPTDRHHIMERAQADTDLIVAAPDLAQTIAGMHEEWAKEFRVNGGIWIPEMWHRNRADAERDQYMRWRDHTTTIESRLVRRLVSETEVVEP